jgi:uncharacterized membrane protein YdfJ with MMPL/SSD domain
MADLQDLAKPALERLLQAEPDQLFAELGLRQKAIENDPAQAGLFEPAATYDASFAGPLDILKEFGQDFFGRVNMDLYSLVCGDDAKFASDRKKLVDALGLGDVAFAGALTAVLITSFGLAPAIATVVAALVVKLFFKNALAAMCAVWKKRLPASL